MENNKKENYYEKKQAIIRLDHWLYDEIQKIAEDEERNFNSQVIYILKEYVKKKLLQNKNVVDFCSNENP